MSKRVQSVRNTRLVMLRVDDQVEKRVCDVCGGIRSEVVQTNLYVSQPYTPSGLAVLTSTFIIVGIGIFKYLVAGHRCLVWLGPVTLWLRSPIKRIEWQQPVLLETSDAPKENPDDKD